jgi:hypothetical protein
LDDPFVADLQRQLAVKDDLLTETRLEALSSASQLQVRPCGLKSGFIDKKKLAKARGQLFNKWARQKLCANTIARFSL